MQISITHTGWSYNANNGPLGVFSVTNNSSSRRRLLSITARYGTGSGNLTDPYPGSDPVNGSGASFTAYLTVGGVNSNSFTVSSKCYIKTWTHQSFNTDSTTRITASFGDNGILFEPNETKTVSITKSSGVLVMPSSGESTSNLYVTDKPDYVSVSSVSLSKSSPQYMYYTSSPNSIQTSFTTTATISPSNATNKSVSWTSSNTAVATVSNGTVKAVGSGSCTITCKAADSKSASITVYVYSKPTIDSLSVSPLTNNSINANTTCSIGWGSWSGKSFPNGKDTTSLSMLIDGKSVSISGSSWSNTLQNYVPFSRDNVSIEIKVTRKHDATGVTVSSSKNIKVLYTPIKYTNTLNKIGTIDISLSRNFVLQFPYESNGSLSNPSNGQYGIVTGYRVTYTRSDTDGKFVKDYNSSGTISNYYSAICEIPNSSLIPTIPYDVTIQAIYKSGSNVGLGPARTIKEFFTLASKLNKPTISFPYTSANGSWQNNAFRIGFTLPSDPDYNYLSVSDRNNYSYSNVEVSLTANGVTRTFISYPGAFSVDNLTYRSNIVFNPRLANGSIYSTNTIKVRVKKNITDNDTLAWSDWSDEVVIRDASIFKEYGYITKSESNFNMTYLDNSTNRTIIMSTNGYITVPIISRLISYSNRLLATYFSDSDYQKKKVPEISLTASNVIIDRSVISKIYNNMIDIINKINQFGKNHSATKTGILYDSYSNYEFSTKSNMIVTSSKYAKDGSDGKDNYFQRLIDLMAYMQDLDKY